YETKSGASRVALSHDVGRKVEAAAPEVKLRAAVAVDAAAFAALRDATERFLLSRPNIRIELRNFGEARLLSEYEAVVNVGEGPDIWLLPTELIRSEAASGRLVALDDYITAERQSQWFEPVRGSVRWNGYLWGV